MEGSMVLLYRKEPFYSRVPEYQAAHLGFFVFIMEFPTLFSMQELSEKLLLPPQSPLLRLTAACQLTEQRDHQTGPDMKTFSVQIKVWFGSKVILW